jgi:hypothetical protein
MTKANKYRWKHGNSNVKASAHIVKSMYDAKEVVRLMAGYAEMEVKKFHKSDVSGEFPLSEKKCGKCEMLGDAAPCDECYRKSGNFR